MSGGGANTHLRAITSDQLIVGQHVRGSCWNLAIAITMMNQLYFSYELRLKGALEGRKQHHLRQPLEAKYLVFFLFPSLEG